MIYEKTFPNGFELVIQKTSAPVAALQVWVDVGSIDEKPAESGFCHFIEHMLFKGTNKRTTQQIAGTVEGAGGEMNAFTSFEYTVYHITLSNQSWKLAHEILSDMVLGSIFKPSEFNPEKEVILEEIKRTYDSPERQLYQEVFKNFYGASNYGRPVIGFPKTIKPCSASDLKNFWKKWYSPELMTFVICGDVDIAEVEREVAKTFGALNSGKNKKPPRKRRREYQPSVAFQKPKDLQNSKHFPINTIKWSGAVPACNVASEDMAALDLTSLVLGQGEASRLNQRLYQKEGIVTAVGTGVWTPMNRGLFTFDVETSIEKAASFRKPLLEEIEKFLKHGPEKEELDRAKSLIESDRVYSLQSMESLAHRLGLLKVTLNNLRYDLEYNAKCRELLPTEIQQTAEKYFRAAPMRETVLLPKDYDAKKFWQGETSVTRMNESKKVTEKTNSVGLQEVDLNNGIKLILNPRTELGVVSLQACVLAGSRVETPDLAGVGNILSDVWEKGPQGWTTEKFSYFLESKASSIDGFSGRNSIGLSMTTLTQNLPELLDVFIETFFNPKLDQLDFSRSQMVALEDIRSIEDRPERLVMKMFYESFYEKHPYSYPIVGFQDSVSKLTAEKIKEHFNKWIKNAPIVISASGKFDPQYLIEQFSKIKRNSDFKSNTLALPFSPPSKEKKSEKEKNREQSHLIVGFAGLKLSDKERYDLKVLMNLLGGQSGRLFRNLRDKEGLCYTVSPTNFEGIEPGFVGVYMGCAPVKRKQALEGIQRELEQIIKKPLSKEEVERAKRFLLGRYHMDLQLNSAIASTTGFNALYGLGFDEHTKMKERLNKVSPQSIQKIAGKIFSGPSVTAVVV